MKVKYASVIITNSACDVTRGIWDSDLSSGVAVQSSCLTLAG